MARVLEVVQMSEEMVSRDNRRFKTIGVIPVTEENEPISTQRVHKRNIWNRQPLDGEWNPYYDRIKVGSKILGDIVTLPTKTYYIENDRGRYVDKNGQRYNRVQFKTYVVFEDDNAEQMRRNDGLDPDQSPEETRMYGTYITDIEVEPIIETMSEDIFEQDQPESERQQQQ